MVFNCPSSRKTEYRLLVKCEVMQIIGYHTFINFTNEFRLQISGRQGFHFSLLRFQIKQLSGSKVILRRIR